MSASDIAEALKEVHSQGIAIHPRTADELNQGVESDLDTSHGLDNADWNKEDGTKDKAKEYHTDRGICLPSSHAYAAHCHSNSYDHEIPPIRRIGISGHQLVVDVVVSSFCLLTRSAEAVEEVTETHRDFVSVV